MHKALLWKKLNNAVQCQLCNHYCIIKPGETGFCRVRKNVGGTLYSLVYGKLAAVAVDPIEKKPLYHFLPGTNTFSISTVGCNFTCKFCQNWGISQCLDAPTKNFTPEQVVQQALENDCKSISYTYVEPTIFYEFAKDCSKLAHENGLKNVFVSNGFMSKEMIADYDSLDAANIDIKGDDRFYREMTGGRLEPVLESIKLLYKKGVHVEVTNLIIPGYNDDEDSLKMIIDFVKLLKIPLHFTAFHPDYKLNIPGTPKEIVLHAKELALESGVKHVYCGNI